MYVFCIGEFVMVGVNIVFWRMLCGLSLLCLWSMYLVWVRCDIFLRCGLVIWLLLE